MNNHNSNFSENNIISLFGENKNNNKIVINEKIEESNTEVNINDKDNILSDKAHEFDVEYKDFI